MFLGVEWANYKISLIFIVFFIFTGCGGGSGSDSSQPVSSFKNGYLIDSYISGVEYYRNGNLADTTNENGLFSYKDGETITFMIGKLELGAISQVSDDSHVTIQDLCKLKRDMFDHPCILNLATLLQSLDVDGNPSNGIKIEEDAKTFFTTSYKIKDLSSIEIKVLVQSFGKNVRSQASVISHLKETMQAKGITPKILDENTLPLYYDTKVSLPPLPQN